MRIIAADEATIEKGRKYATAIYELEKVDPIFVDDGKSAKALEFFWEMSDPRSREGEKIKCYSIGMGEPAELMW